MTVDPPVRWHEYVRPLVDDTHLVMRFSTRAAGDFHIDGDPALLDDRRRQLVDRPWAWVRQVHGAAVIEIPVDGDDRTVLNGTEADALVTRSTDVAVSVTVADCAPVVLWGDEGTVAVAHAGWRGVSAGVIDATVTAMRSAGDRRITAMVGPCIAPADYEFGLDELDRMAQAFGPAVRSTTRWGAPALDLRAAAESALELAGAALDRHLDLDTASPQYFSHRVRRDPERLVAVAWKKQS